MLVSLMLKSNYPLIQNYYLRKNVLNRITNFTRNSLRKSFLSRRGLLGRSVGSPLPSRGIGRCALRGSSCSEMERSVAVRASLVAFGLLLCRGWEKQCQLADGEPRHWQIVEAPPHCGEVIEQHFAAEAEVTWLNSSRHVGTLPFVIEEVEGIHQQVIWAPAAKDFFGVTISENPKAAVTKRRKRGRLFSDKLQYDPAVNEKLNGHCFDACLWKMLFQTQPTLCRALAMRKLMKQIWIQLPSALESQAAAEHLSPEEYLQSYVVRGWGGTAELEPIDIAVGINACVENEKGEVIWAARNRDANAVRWRLADNHFTLVG